MNKNSIRRSLKAFVATTTIALGIAVVAGCAPDPTSEEPADPAAASASSPAATPTETDTPETELASGDVVPAEQAKTLNEDNADLTVAYPVGGEYVVLKWGDPVPESMRLEVEKNVKAATPGLGTSTDIAEDAGRLREALTAESSRLGGVSVALSSAV